MGWIRPKPGTAAEAHPAKIYLELREAALHMNADAAGRTEDNTVDRPYAVVTDLGAERGSATILATIGGAASIYFSNGGGAIGGEGVDQIREAAHQCVEVARAATAHFRTAESFPVASSGEVRFYLISGNGVSVASAPEAALTGPGNDLTPLYSAVQNIITGYRLMQEAMKG